MDKSIFTNKYSLLLRLLRQARKKAGQTQEQLAARLGQSQSFVSKCERGERRLDVIELRAFCTALGLPLSEFIADLERAIENVEDGESLNDDGIADH